MRLVLLIAGLFTGSILSNDVVSANRVDSLKICLSQENDPVKQARIYEKLSQSFSDQFDSTLFYSHLFLQKATQTTDTFLLADAYYQLADAYYYQHYDSSLHYAQLYLETALLTGDDQWIAYGHDLLAYAHSEKGDVIESLEHYRKALEYFTRSADSSRMAASNINIGYTLSFGKEQAGGLKYFLKGLKLAESIGDTLILSDAYFNVAYYYYRAKDYEASYNYYQQSLKLSLEVQHADSGSIALTYALLAQVSLKRDKIADFESFMHLSKHLFKHVSTEYDQTNLYSCYLENYLEAKQTDSCWHYLHLVENNLKNKKFKLLEAYTLQHHGRLLLLEKKYAESINYLHQSIEMFNRHKSVESFTDTYTYIARAYAAMHQFQNAYQWQIKANAFMDSLNMGAVERILAEYEQNKVYETELHREKLEMELEQQKMDNTKLQYRNRLRLLLAAVISMLAFIAASVFYYRSIKKNNQLLIDQKAIIEQQKNQLEARNAELSKNEKRLNELNVTKDKFFSIIAHDLRNPFYSIIGLSELILKKKENVDEEKSIKIIDGINNTAKHGYTLLENLLEWSKSQTGKLAIKAERIQPHELIKGLITDFNELTNSKHIDIDLQANSLRAIDADKNMLTTVLRNLIHNAIKFSYERSVIEITIDEKDEHLSISIRDQGIGISESDLPKLFNIDSQVLKKGTRMEKGSGLGLILCKEFVEKNKGTIQAESIKYQGATFTITFPVA